MRSFARRRRPVIAIHRLEHDPVRIDVQPALAATVGDRQRLRRAVLVDDRTLESVLDIRARPRSHAFSAGPQKRRLDVEPPHGALLGEQHEHRRIARDECRLIRIQSLDELRQRIEHRKALVRQPRARARLPFPRHDAGVMIVAGGDQRRLAAASEHARRVACAEARRAELHGDHRVVGRKRGGVLHEYPRLAAGARALPHRIAPEETLADVCAVGEKGLDAGARERSFGHPAVEIGHQLGLGDHRKRFERSVRRHIAPPVAIMR